jgi:hypothetical protein
MKFRRCVVLSGIHFDGLRGDLADRLISFDLQYIAEGNRKPDSDRSESWPKDWPQIFGAVLDLAATVHSELPRLPRQPLPRMADFSRVLICVDKVLDGENGENGDGGTGSDRGTGGMSGIARYRERLHRSIAETAESDPFIDYLVNQKYDTGESGKTAREILNGVRRIREAAVENGETGAVVGTEDWPRSPRSVTALLKRNAPALRSMGYGVANDGGHNDDGIVKWTVRPQT